ncbi:hypothetical protein NE237_029635 [Protea cynaroides]|uniref:Uncharacterized protein n=1 Tax=Protea cynaroides TaxID=273540 RepID=A0A9Q0JWF8_9MAGN|nr:hypothetical protein NE237_029635 [Protea cynaroides]
MAGNRRKTGSSPIEIHGGEVQTIEAEMTLTKRKRGELPTATDRTTMWSSSPAFGTMMILGQTAAHLALKALGLPNAIDGSYNNPLSIQPELILIAADSTSEIVGT